MVAHHFLSGLNPIYWQFWLGLLLVVVVLFARGGILGALLTGVFAAPSLGGTGICNYVTNTCGEWGGIGSQIWIQAQGVFWTIVISGVVAFVAYKIVDLTVGLRVPEDEEREGLDISSHGETAYNK